MIYTFFEYNEQTQRFVYTENQVEYSMPLLQMLRLKSFLRSDLSTALHEPIRQWFDQLADDDRREVEVLEALSFYN